MWIISVALTATLVSCVWAKPQPPQAVASAGPESTPIPIITQSENLNPDGSFSYSFETGNGIKAEETGVQKPNPNPKSEDGNATIQVVNGTFTYTAPDGTQINLRYVADENGFQPTGDHLPTPPPIPDEIQKSLALIAQNSQNAEVAVTPKV